MNLNFLACCKIEGTDEKNVTDHNRPSLKIKNQKNSIHSQKNGQAHPLENRLRSRILRELPTSYAMKYFSFKREQKLLKFYFLGY